MDHVISAGTRPMKAVSGPLPAGDGWVYEVKWDGMRAVVLVDDGRVRLMSANGNDATASYPELTGLGSALGIGSAVLDGEIVALDDHGRPDFGRLQSRMHVRSLRQAAERAATTPVTLMLFDILALEGTPTVDLPWRERRHLLTDLVDPGPHWQVPASYDDGPALLEAARAAHLEGVVAKRVDSTYRPGTRTREWVKVKVRHRQEFVVGGWATGSGGFSSRLAALAIGYHDGPRAPLRFAGRVGSGLSEAESGALADLLTSHGADACPFDPPPPRPLAAGMHWVEPVVVVEVAFSEWTGDGMLRHPTYCGRRVDVDAEQVTSAP